MVKLELTKITRPGSDDVLYAGDNIEISVKDKIINNIVAFIPSDLNIPHVFMIYKMLTGTMPSEYAIMDLYPYEILTKLEACYPCVEKIKRDDLYNPKICPSGIGVGCDKNGIKITVVYGEYDKRDIWQVAQAYSIGDKRIRDAVGKVYGHNWANNLSKELSVVYNKKADKTIEKLKKRINAIYGYDHASICDSFGVPTFEAFDAITDELKDTYIKKNHDYGNSFDKSIDKFGLTAAVVRMSDKMERLSSLINKDAKVNESIRDTVMDLANYCIMTAMYLDNKKENK